MARRVIWGTPGRSEHYLRPRSAWTLMRPALLLAGLVALAYLGAQLLGARAALSPGRVSARHGTYDAACEQCHLPRGAGAASIRCQRCHDPASGGRLTLAAHVYFGSLDPAKAAAAGELACARCHVEHRGAQADLKHVDDAHCSGCHADAARVDRPFSRLERHPEFQVLARGAQQLTGLRFSHLTHVTGRNQRPAYLLADPDLRQRGLQRPADTCGECHLLGARDFEPIDFDDHCVKCHRTDALRFEPVAAGEVVSFETLAAEPRRVQGWVARAEDFTLDGDRVDKRVQHADEWVRLNLHKLRRELDPQGAAAEERALAQRRADLERRLVLARPLAQDDAAQLEARAQAAREEIARLEARLRAQAQAPGPQAGLARVEEAERAAQLLGDDQERARAADLLAQARASAAAPRLNAPLPEGAFEARREELLRVLTAVERAAPGRRAQVDELRRQLAGLRPGEVSVERLERLRRQRQATLERLEDEARLRRSGTAPPAETSLRQEVRALERERDEVARQLELFDLLPAPAAAELGEDERARKRETVGGLALGCRYCHEVSPEGAFAPVAAARPVLWRAAFRHREHLTHGESCASCHAGTRAGSAFSVETSAQSSDLSLRGIDSCRECHRRGQATRDCRGCHDFHPRAGVP